MLVMKNLLFFRYCKVVTVTQSKLKERESPDKECSSRTEKSTIPFFSQHKVSVRIKANLNIKNQSQLEYIYFQII
jgi:hypothetical protein